MAPTDAQKRASAKYQKENISSLACRVKKDQAEKFKAYCEGLGTTPNSAIKDYILSCIGEENTSMTKNFTWLSDEQIVNRLRGRLRKHGAKIHVISADQCEDHQTRYQILLKDEDPADHVDDESGFYTLSKLVDVVAELDENYFGNKE